MIPLSGKHPAVSTWKVNQTIRVTDDAGLVKWFTLPGVTGLGVILGRVSGHLFVRDYDDAAAYRRWAEAFPTQANALPTVKTIRGFHVYGRFKGLRPRTFADGELRAEGQYVAAPPSKHPAGPFYSWVVPPPAGDVPEIDPAVCGLLESPLPNLLERAAESTESDESYERSEPPEESEHCIGLSDTRDTLSLRCAPHNLDGLIEAAIQATLPTEWGQRHRRLFAFARHLKAIPALVGKPARDLKPFVRRWFDAALPTISSRDFDETWGEFAKGWSRVKWAHGDGPLVEALRRAQGSNQPDCAAQYGPALRLLVAILRELQRAAGDSPIFVSGLKVGDLVGVHPGTGTRYLQGLVADGVLEVVSRPPRGAIRAIRYRYLGD